MALGGAVTNGGGLRSAAIRVSTERVRAQRFFLAGLLGCVASMPDGEHLWPVTTAATARMKLQRAFAQVFLCPWAALDAFRDEGDR